MILKRIALLLSSFCFILSAAKAETLLTTIANIHTSWNNQYIHVLSGADGNTYVMKKNERNLKTLKYFGKQPVKIDYYRSKDQRVIQYVSYASYAEIDAAGNLNHFGPSDKAKFTPTDIKDLNLSVENIFENLNRTDYRDSECFKRAHIWNFDMWSEYGIQSQKLFIFYTRRFVSLEDDKWRFHVAPLVVSDKTEYVMDRTFFDKPVTVKQWVSKFIKSEKITCPLVDDYNYVEAHEYSHLCYLVKVPMYYLSPYDLGNNDAGTFANKSHWLLEELQDARRSFKYDDMYFGLDTGKPTIKY